MIGAFAALFLAADFAPPAKKEARDKMGNSAAGFNGKPGLPGLSIVIPVRNTGHIISSLCQRLMEMYGRNGDLEIVLVNDGSTDNSHAICQDMCERFGGTSVYLRLSRPFGENSAVMAGLNHVGGNYCVVMNELLTGDPEDIGVLLKEMVHDFDVVYFERDFGSLSFAGRLMDRIAGYLFHRPPRIDTGRMKAVNRFVTDEIAKYRGPAPDVDTIIFRSTAKVGRVRPEISAGLRTRANHSWLQRSCYWSNLVLGYSIIPLRLVGGIGLLLMLWGLYHAFVALLAYLIQGLDDPTDYEILLSVRGLYRGLLLLAVSVVGEYVGRIYLRVKDAPQYIIREKITASPAASMEPRE